MYKYFIFVVGFLKKILIYDFCPGIQQTQELFPVNARMIRIQVKVIHERNSCIYINATKPQQGEV